MKEILQELLAAEAKAKETLQRAEEEASKVLEEASREGQSLVEQARKTATEESRRLIQDGARRASTERESEIRRFTEALAKKNYGSPEAKERGVKEVLRILTGQAEDLSQANAGRG